MTTKTPEAFTLTPEMIKKRNAEFEALSPALRDRALDFGNNFVSEDEWDEDNETYEFDADGCMRAIMQNVIDNNGEFKP